MKTVSFQGLSLSAAQRRQVELRSRMRPVDTSVLRAQVEETLAAVKLRKEQGVKPDQQYFHVSNDAGTPSVAEWMGY
ncbi:hypothetical protein AABC73_13480 [Pseudomonas sp. G.S.17]|uniref:hypothetical protein n=1 Tax=Pseudomonas sp. G.S.17 TaxID=3137451 RepID=UPI00311CAE8B